MRTINFIVIVLIFTSMIAARKVKKCRGRNGKKYDVGQGYETKCRKFTCTKNIGKRGRQKMLVTNIGNCCKSRDKMYKQGEEISLRSYTFSCFNRSWVFADKEALAANNGTRMELGKNWKQSRVAYEGSNWMHKVHGSLKLYELSIPGTHNSMAFKTRHEEWFENHILCQTEHLWYQLMVGVRFFDIRLNISRNKLWCVHGPAYLSSTFEDVIIDFWLFLYLVPSETIIMRFKHGGWWGYGNNYRKFCQLLGKTLEMYPLHLWGDQIMPTLDQIRGKLVVINWDGTRGCYGSEFDRIDLDNYNGKGPHPITGNGYEDTTFFWDGTARDQYVEELESFMDVARLNTKYKHDFMFTWASATGLNSDPERIASKVNKRLTTFFGRHPYGRVGIVAFDFIDERNKNLPSLVYRRNFNQGLPCTLYKYNNMKGDRISFSRGRHANLGFFNAIASSASLYPGCRLHFWNSKNYRGEQSFIFYDTTYLGNYWNDAIRSVNCVCG